MPEKRCPMCGKANPAELDVCQFCQARLKPIQIPPPVAGPNPPTKPQKHITGPLPTPEEREMPDWLRDLRQHHGASTPGSDGEAPASRVPSAPDPSSPTGREQSPMFLRRSGVTDWLTDMRSDPDWNAGLPADSEAETASLESEPEWLKRVQSQADLPLTPSRPSEQSTLPESHQSEPATPPSESEVPDWLAKSRPPQGVPVPPQDSTPDWLKALDTNPEMPGTLPKAGTFVPAPAQTAGLPDWLAALELNHSAEKPFPPPETLPPESVAPTLISEPVKTDDFIDWMGSSEAASPSSIPGIEDGVPDWMSGILSGAALPALPTNELAENPLSTAGPAEQPDGEISALTPDSDLSWLNNLENQAAVHPAISPFANDQESQQELASIAETGALPSWLNDAASQSTAGNSDLPTDSHPESDSNLAPAELPSWLEAMRPPVSQITSQPFETGSDVVESAGPLIGLRAVLPAEPDVTLIQKPPVYPIKLQVSDTHQVSAALFSELLQMEGQARPVPGRPVISSQHLLRLAIAFILSIFIIWPLLTHKPETIMPSLPSDDPPRAASQLAHNLIEEYGAGQVLVSIDYQPGLSGEMTALACAVLDRLMTRGAYLAFVSTSPTGPLQAENVLVRLAQRNGQDMAYHSPEQYYNLGFIPGGPVGLVGFAEAPRAVLPFASAGNPIKNINSLSEFSLAIVITENPDLARSWIEQVQPALKTTPLILVVSAQAEPLVRPYFETVPRQVQGMLAGLADGAAYENVNGHKGLTTETKGLSQDYWGAYSLSVLIAAFLIAIGGVLNVAVNLLAQRKTPGRGGAKS